MLNQNQNNIPYKDKQILLKKCINAKDSNFIEYQKYLENQLKSDEVLSLEKEYKKYHNEYVSKIQKINVEVTYLKNELETLKFSKEKQSEQINAISSTMESVRNNPRISNIDKDSLLKDLNESYINASNLKEQHIKKSKYIESLIEPLELMKDELVTLNETNYRIFLKLNSDKLKEIDKIREKLKILNEFYKNQQTKEEILKNANYDKEKILNQYNNNKILQIYEDKIIADALDHKFINNFQVILENFYQQIEREALEFYGINEQNLKDIGAYTIKERLILAEKEKAIEKQIKENNQNAEFIVRGEKKSFESFKDHIYELILDKDDKKAFEALWSITDIYKFLSNKFPYVLGYFERNMSITNPDLNMQINFLKTKETIQKLISESEAEKLEDIQYNQLSELGMVCLKSYNKTQSNTGILKKIISKVAEKTCGSKAKRLILKEDETMKIFNDYITTLIKTYKVMNNDKQNYDANLKRCGFNNLADLYKFRLLSTGININNKIKEKLLNLKNESELCDLYARLLNLKNRIFKLKIAPNSLTKKDKDQIQQDLKELGVSSSSEFKVVFKQFKEINKELIERNQINRSGVEQNALNTKFNNQQLKK